MGSGPSIPDVVGFRVFKVNPGSPAFAGGLEVFFDFIVEIDGVHVEDETVFHKLLQASEGQPAKFTLYSVRTSSHREVVITPRRWEGLGLLGAVVRWDMLHGSENHGIRVLDVFPNSPAHVAGLLPSTDYLLCTNDMIFREIDELIDIVNLHMERQLVIYVYNSEVEAIREVVIVPNNRWGGSGSIGADIRTGVLHRIPPPRRKYVITQQEEGALGPQQAAVGHDQDRNLEQVRSDEMAVSAQWQPLVVPGVLGSAEVVAAPLNDEVVTSETDTALSITTDQQWHLIDAAPAEVESTAAPPSPSAVSGPVLERSHITVRDTHTPSPAHRSETPPQAREDSDANPTTPARSVSSSSALPGVSPPSFDAAPTVVRALDDSRASYRSSTATDQSLPPTPRGAQRIPFRIQAGPGFETEPVEFAPGIIYELLLNEGVAGS